MAWCLNDSTGDVSVGGVVVNVCYGPPSMMKTSALVSFGLVRAVVNAAVRSSGTFIPEGADMVVDRLSAARVVPECSVLSSPASW